MGNNESLAAWRLLGFRMVAPGCYDNDDRVPYMTPKTSLWRCCEPVRTTEGVMVRTVQMENFGNPLTMRTNQNTLRTSHILPLQTRIHTCKPWSQGVI